MSKFIVKPDEWFKSGTEAKLIEDFTDYRDGRAVDRCPYGLFEGIRVSEGEGIHLAGVEYLDQEMCTFDEFDIID